MIPVLNPNHPSATDPSPTRDVPAELGYGTQYRAERELQGGYLPVSVTNPQARSGYTRAVREERGNICARAVNVHARASNQVPSQTVDALADDGSTFILAGEGDGPAPGAPQEGFLSSVPVWGWVALGALGVGLMLRRG
jgi:hypothetical protein